MGQEIRAIQIGEALPPLRLETGFGESVELTAWGGRPLLIACLRYYG
jgi:hypothetical protein